MSKKKKWTVVPYLSVATIVVLLISYIVLRKPAKPAEPIKAIPLSASVILKINDFSNLKEKTTGDNAIWKELRSIPLFGRIERQLNFLDSLTGAVPEVEQILENPPSFLSFHVTGNEKISLLHVLQLPEHMQGKKLAELIGRLVGRSGTIKVRTYEGISIHEVMLQDQSQIDNFVFAVYSDILMISFSPTLLEDAIRQLGSDESLASVDGFTAMYATAGKNVDVNVFINFQEFPRSLAAFVKPVFKQEVRSFKNFAGWAELDLNPLTDLLLMNGFVNPPDSVPSVASILMNQSPQRFTADEILPASLSSFLTFNLSDAERYFKDYRDFLQDQGKLTGYTNTLLSLNNSYGTDFPNDFLEIMDGEITLGFDGTPEGSPPNIYLLFRVKSKTQAEDKFRSVLSAMAVAESKSIEAFTSDFRFDSDLSFRIYQLPARKLTSKIFGSLFSILDEHYFVVLDGYLVFSGTPESLKSLIHNYVLNKTLRNDPAYKEFKNNLSPRSNLCFFCNLSKSQPFYSTYLTRAVNESWQKNADVFRTIQVLGIQLYANNNMLYSNFLVTRQTGFSASAQTVWESKLDTLTDFKPVFVVNHQTGRNEVFVQDLNNSIYLINQSGRILWKIRLPERIRSEIYQVDYFRNGKLQLLFSTRSAIYLIDRNGNFVEKYPVTLRSPATNGVAVFDYDNNRDYRLFIACEDLHVYAYTREGNLLTGWEFEKSESEVTQPLNHFRIGDKDFLVFGDLFKTYILDRRGHARINVDSYFPRSANNSYQLNLVPGDNGPSLVTTDSTGKVYFIGFDGKVNSLELQGKFSNRHFFDYKDLTGEGKPEYIYLEDDKLTVFNNDQKRLFTFSFEGPVSARPQYYQFSSGDRKLGFVSRNENLIYLINNNGELYNGFPLQGNTPFSIGNFGDSLSRFNLIVGSRDNFLYNYRVK